MNPVHCDEPLHPPQWRWNDPKTWRPLIIITFGLLSVVAYLSESERRRGGRQLGGMKGTSPFTRHRHRTWWRYSWIPLALWLSRNQNRKLYTEHKVRITHFYRHSARWRLQTPSMTRFYRSSTFCCRCNSYLLVWEWCRVFVPSYWTGVCFNQGKVPGPSFAREKPVSLFRWLVVIFHHFPP